jgi:hypothetical protein
VIILKLFRLIENYFIDNELTAVSETTETIKSINARITELEQAGYQVDTKIILSHVIELYYQYPQTT